MKKIICAALAAVMCIGLFGCGDKNDGNLLGDVPDGDVAMEDLPYGATLVELKKGEKAMVKVCFDKRFFGDHDGVFGDIYLLTKYIDGLNKNNAEQVVSCFYPGYIESTCEGLGMTTADYVDGFYQNLVADLGENFSIDYIDVSDVYDITDSYASDYINVADKFISEHGGGEELTKIRSRVVFEVGGNTMYSSDSKASGMLTNASSIQTFCIYDIDGQYYLF